MIFARFEMDFAKFCKIAPKRKNEGISTSEMDFAGFRNLFCRNSQNLVLGGSPSKMSITSGYSHWRVASLPRSIKKSGMKY